MFRKILITIGLLCVLVTSWSRDAFHKELGTALGSLYVYHEGRVTDIENLSRQNRLSYEVLLQNGSSLRIFPYPLEGQIIWFASDDPLPAEIPESERIFIMKVQDYIQELCAEKDLQAAIEVIEKTKKYQEKNARLTLPTRLALRLERHYYSSVFRILYYLIAIMLIANVFIKRKSISALGLLFVSICFAIRWIVGAHIPMASGFDVMLFLCWSMLAIGFCLEKRPSRMLPTCSVVAGLVMTAAGLCCETAITALPTSLQSPLLGFHVGITIFSYALFALMAVSGKKDLLLPGILFLGVGIVLGSIWAKSAWGAYWTWDPKETWALITLVVYSIGLFDKRIPFLQGKKAFHVFSIVAFLFVLFTYFGVNYLIGGLHGYV